AGTSPYGGVLVAAGDDHNCKSSTIAQQSEFAFIDAMMPVLNPTTVEELIEFGLLGYGMSRFSGCWVGMKVIPETADASQAIDFDHESFSLVAPSFSMPPGGLSIRWPDPPLDQEARLHRYKLDAAQAFARANNLDRTIIDGPRPQYGIVTSGKTHSDTMQALEDLGLSPGRASETGIRLYKVGMSWPLEPVGARAFADGLDEIFVIEEKRSLIESQLKELLFDVNGAKRPTIVGKHDEGGEWLLPSSGELNTGVVAAALGKRLARFFPSASIDSRLAYLARKDEAIAKVSGNEARRPHFCSGCPHNTSTRVPDGSRAIAGIGCHFMVAWMGRNTETYTQMGGEGASWIGHAPFTDTEHVFQNIGDGTYVHSGSLAIRAAVASGVNMTYKVLHNDAVAMTGGQSVEGGFTAGQVARQLVAEGVKPVVVVTDDVERMKKDSELPGEVAVHHRGELDAVQLKLRDQPGVSGLIYVQTCAAELRRKRKRNLIETPSRRVVINEAVCEGCGDCNKVSNCLSVVPIETEFGRKRQINQSACNRDYSCLDGFCPSFVTVRDAALKAPTAQSQDQFPDLPEPVIPDLSKPYNVLVAGVGGTGVVTASGLIGLAAHLDGKAVMELDQTGLAQKFGAVLSHLRVANSGDDLHGARIPVGQVDLLLGGDLLVAAGKDTLLRLSTDRTSVLVNSHEEMPPSFINERDLEFPGQALMLALRETSRADGFHAVDASRLAFALTGDALSANVFLLGAALQRGLLPVTVAAIERALELFGANVERNKLALNWGRYSVVDGDETERLAGGVESEEGISRSLDETVARRAEYLTQYQDDTYADRFRSAVASIHEVEERILPGSTDLANAVARNYFKLLAYKDEYEVARLYTETGFLDKLCDEYEGKPKLEFHFSPPLISGTDPSTGRPRKKTFGAWSIVLLRMLARMRFLRGSPLDPFSYTGDRKLERRLLAEYEADLEAVCKRLDGSHFAAALELMSLPDQIRGFGPIKAQAAEETAQQRHALLEEWPELAG
ncbi:MAG: indolepyruvate ferredoxin oxidoreductase family protein, partial [Gammaproteobacteria bacterium]